MAIRLWVVSRGETDVNVEVLAEYAEQAEINTTLKVLKINMRLAETMCYVLFNLVKSPLFYSTYSTDLSSRK